MEELAKILEIIHPLKEYVTSRPSIKGSILLFLTAFLLFLAILIPIVSSILTPMTETIRALILMVMLTSGVYSISAILVNLAEYLYDTMKSKKEQLEAAAR